MSDTLRYSLSQCTSFLFMPFSHLLDMTISSWGRGLQHLTPSSGTTGPSFQARDWVRWEELVAESPSIGRRLIRAMVSSSIQERHIFKASVSLDLSRGSRTQSVLTCPLTTCFARTSHTIACLYVLTDI